MNHVLGIIDSEYIQLLDQPKIFIAFELIWKDVIGIVKNNRVFISFENIKKEEKLKYFLYDTLTKLKSDEFLLSVKINPIERKSSNSFPVYAYIIIIFLVILGLLFLGYFIYRCKRSKKFTPIKTESKES